MALTGRNDVLRSSCGVLSMKFKLLCGVVGCIGGRGSTRTGRGLGKKCVVLEGSAYEVEVRNS